MSSPGPWTPDQRQSGNPGHPQGGPPYGAVPNPGQPYGGAHLGAQPISGQQFGGHPYGGGPAGEQPEKKGGWLKWVLIAVAVLFLIGMCSVAIGGGDEEPAGFAAVTSEPVAPASPGTDTGAEQEEAPAAQAEPAPQPEPEPEPEPAVEQVPREFQNAVRSANQYLDFTSFSRLGLIDQLMFEDYSPEAAEYAVDQVGADWNEQAAKKAEEYLDFTSFSRQGLVDQLLFEKFTPEQAEYGASQAY